MNDPRITNLARILVRYSVCARPRELIAVDSTPLAEPLVLAVYEQLLCAGAFPVLRMSPADAPELFYKVGRPHHFDALHALQHAMADHLHGAIHIESSSNTRALSAVNPGRQARFARTTQPIREKMLRKKWCLTLYPTPAFAQDAEMSLAEFEDFVFAATFADRKDPLSAWRQLSRRQARLVRRLRGADTVRLAGPETDLTLSVRGRRFINSDGHHNMPSGEVFTGPVEDSAHGHIAFDYPVCHAGREIDGIRLVFRKGRVVEASARKNEAFLLAMLDLDRGARRLGELGIGTNEGIRRFTKNILFDEKIGGTVHLALGRSYDETGGKNRSSKSRRVRDSIAASRRNSRSTIPCPPVPRTGP